jgi:hypothetical protein
LPLLLISIFQFLLSQQLLQPFWLRMLFVDPQEPVQVSSRMQLWQPQLQQPTDQHELIAWQRSFIPFWLLRWQFFSSPQLLEVSSFHPWLLIEPFCQLHA